MITHLRNYYFYKNDINGHFFIKIDQKRPNYEKKRLFLSKIKMDNYS